jgi:hypothetical protein
MGPFREGIRMRARDIATGFALLVALGLGTSAAASAAPSARQLSSVPPPDLTVPAENSVVHTATPQLGGTGNPGDTVVVSEASFVRCVGTVGANGHWSCVSTTPLNNGVHHLTATQTDQTGVVSGLSSTLDVTVRVGSAPALTTTPATSVPPTSAVVPPTRFESPKSTAAVSIKTNSSKDDNVLLAVIAVLALACTIAVAAFVKLRPRHRR